MPDEDLPPTVRDDSRLKAKPIPLSIIVLLTAIALAVLGFVLLVYLA